MRAAIAGTGHFVPGPPITNDDLITRHALRIKPSFVQRSIGVATVVAWVKGLQPYPEVVAGAEPGQWYISWRAYEAAVFEPFVARVDCH